MVKNVTVPEALSYKHALEAIDGVTSVTWLDDAASVEQPLETLDQDTVSSYYQDGAALFSVTIADDQRIAAVDAIRALIGDDNAMSGSAVSTAVATTSTVSQIQIISAAAVAFVLLILVLTTTSWLEPLIVLGSLGVAILINSGSNLIFGEISFVSNAAGSILQLAVSLDYSIFLLHRFEECRKETPDPRDAMVEALCKSTMSILSSGLTTVIGFLALCLMQFQIGPDMGLVLGKGVAVSLITVFIFSPSLILLFHHLLEKTRHRSFMPSFHGLGKCVTRLMIPVLLILPIMVVPAYLGSNQNSYYYGSSHIFGPETQLGADIEAIEAVFGKSDTYVLMVLRGNAAREKELSAALKELPQVSSILSYVDNAGSVIPTEYVEKDTLSKLISDHYSRLVLSVKADLEGDAAFSLVQPGSPRARNRRALLSRRVAAGGRRRKHLRHEGNRHLGYGQGQPHRHRGGVHRAAAFVQVLFAAGHPGAGHRGGHLDQHGNSVLHEPERVLHFLSDYHLHPTGRDGGLRHPVHRPVYGVPPHPAQEASHRADRFVRHRFHPHIGPDADGGGLPDGLYLHPRPAQSAGLFPGARRAALHGHRALCPAGHAVSAGRSD